MKRKHPPPLSKPTKDIVFKYPATAAGRVLDSPRSSPPDSPSVSAAKLRASGRFGQLGQEYFPESPTMKQRHGHGDERAPKKAKSGNEKVTDEEALVMLKSVLPDEDPVLATCRIPNRPEGKRAKAEPWQYDYTDGRVVRLENNHRIWWQHPNITHPIYRYQTGFGNKPDLSIFLALWDIKNWRPDINGHTGLSLFMPIHVQQYRLSRPLTHEGSMVFVPFYFVFDQRLVTKLNKSGPTQELLAAHNSATNMVNTSTEFVFAEHVRRFLFDKDDQPSFWQRAPEEEEDDVSSQKKAQFDRDYEEGMQMIYEALGMHKKRGGQTCKCMTVPYRPSGSLDKSHGSAFAESEHRAAEDRIRGHSFPLHSTLLQLSNRVSDCVYLPEQERLLHPTEDAKEIGALEQQILGSSSSSSKQIPQAAVENEWLQPLTPEDSIALLPVTAVVTLLSLYYSLHDDTGGRWTLKDSKEATRRHNMCLGLMSSPWGTKAKPSNPNMLQDIPHRIGPKFAQANPVVGKDISHKDARDGLIRLPDGVPAVYFHTRWRLSVELPAAGGNSRSTTAAAAAAAAAEALNNTIFDKLMENLAREVFQSFNKRDSPELPMFPWRSFGFNLLPGESKYDYDDDDWGWGGSSDKKDDMSTGPDDERKGARRPYSGTPSKSLNFFHNPYKDVELVTAAQELTDAGISHFFQLYLAYTSRRFRRFHNGDRTYEDLASRVRVLSPMPMVANQAFGGQRGERRDAFQDLLADSVDSATGALDLRNDTVVWDSKDITDADYLRVQALRPALEVANALVDVVKAVDKKDPPNKLQYIQAKVDAAATSLAIFDSSMDTQPDYSAPVANAIHNFSTKAKDGSKEAKAVAENLLKDYFRPQASEFQAAMARYMKKFAPTDNLVYHLRKQTVNKQYYMLAEGGWSVRKFPIDMKEVILVIPIHRPGDSGANVSKVGGHYITVIVDSKRKRIMVWDPLNPLSEGVVRDMRRWFDEYLRGFEVIFIRGLLLQASSGNDCGRFVLFFVKNYLESLIKPLRDQGVRALFEIWQKKQSGGSSSIISDGSIPFGWDPERGTIVTDTTHSLFFKDKDYHQTELSKNNGELFRQFQMQLWRIYNRWNPPLKRSPDVMNTLDRAELVPPDIKFPPGSGLEDDDDDDEGRGGDKGSSQMQDDNTMRSKRVPKDTPRPW